MPSTESRIKQSNALLATLFEAIEQYRTGEFDSAFSIVSETNWVGVPEIEQFSVESLWLQLVKGHFQLSKGNTVDAILALLKVSDANSYESIELHIRTNLLLATGHRKLLDYKNCVNYLSECVPFVQKLQGDELKNLLRSLADFAESSSTLIHDILTVEVLTASYIKSKQAGLLEEEEIILEALCQRYLSNGQAERARALFQASMTEKGREFSLASPRNRTTFGSLLLASGDVMASMNMLKSAVLDSLDGEPRLCVTAALAYARAERQSNIDAQVVLDLLLRVESEVREKVALKYQYGLLRQIALRYGRLGQYEEQIQYVQAAIDILDAQEKLDVELVAQAKQQQERLVKAKSELERIAESNTRLNDALTKLANANRELSEKTEELVSVLRLLSKQFDAPVATIVACIEELTEAPHDSAKRLMNTTTDFKNTVLLLLETIKAEQSPPPEMVSLSPATVYASSELGRIAPLQFDCEDSSTCSVFSEVQGSLVMFFAMSQYVQKLRAKSVVMTLFCEDHGSVRFELSIQQVANEIGHTNTVPSSLVDLVGKSSSEFELLLCLLCLNAASKRLGWQVDVQAGEHEVSITLHDRINN